MKTILMLTCVCALFFTACTTKKSEPQTTGVQALNAGIGIVDITGDSAVILDPLHVRAILFKQGNEQAVLVECEVTGIPSAEALDARMKVSEKTGIPVSNICIASTHTHMTRPHKEIVPAIVEAVSAAQSDVKPVNLKSALGQQFNVSFNRRYFMKDGSVVFNPMFLNPDIVRPVGPIDPEVGIVLISDAGTDKPLASLLNFALHLDIVKEYGAVYQKSGAGSRNSVSADYPYWIEKSLRNDFGNEFNSIFFTGCCGNINHWDFSKPGPQSGHQTKSKEVGDSLYASVKRALPSAKVEEGSLAVLSEVVDVPLQSFTEDDLAWAKQVSNSALSSKSEEPNERQQFLDGVKRRRIIALNELKEKGITSLKLDVQVVRLSKNTAIVTLPGEMFVEHGLMIKNSSPFENTFVVELSNNSVSYVPNKKAFSQGGYEVENSRLAPGGGEMMAHKAIEMLNSLNAK